jgi:hypothetical protein
MALCLASLAVCVWRSITLAGAAAGAWQKRGVMISRPYQWRLYSKKAKYQAKYQDRAAMKV